MAYIDLNRSFASISKDHEFDESDFEHAFLNAGKTTHWPDILKLKRVVILAEAGVGKTEEITMITNRIRANGEKAFFLRLEHLCNDFEISFEIGTFSEYQEWLTADESAWFFLDSVDEARMSNPKYFETAIRKLSVKLGDYKQRAKICITSRPSEWRAKSDITLIQSWLPYFETKEIGEGQDHEDLSPNDAENHSVQMNHTKNSQPVDPSVYGIQPLNNAQKKQFAEGLGVRNTKSFLIAIEKSEADIFSGTPQDLIELISYWNSKGTISNRAKMIEFGINSKLTEVDPDRASTLPLAAEDALYGAKCLAAAATFLRENRILIPDHGLVIRSESIDTHSVLGEWSADQCRALLLRPIFDKAIYGTVRFHHRSAREYLTAQWLYDLLQSGKSRRSIESLFFSERYGEQVSIPSMRSVLAWLILWDDQIRQRTAEISPEVLLQGGDPSSLPIEVRCTMLRIFCQHYAEQCIGHLSFDIAEVRRFAHTDLGQMINQLLDMHSENDEVVELLLRMVWQGEIQNCSNAVLINALDAETSAYRRMYAIQALASIGSNQQKQQFIASVIADRELKNERIIGEIISELAPTHLGVEGVISLLSHVRNRDRFSVSTFYCVLENYVLQNCRSDELFDWIQRARSMLKQEPVVEKRFFEVSQNYAWLLPVAALAAERLVKENSPDALKAEVLEVISLSQASRYYDSYRSSRHTLDKLVPEHSELNQALFWFDVGLARKHLNKKKGARLTEWRSVNSLDNYWRFNSDNFEDVLRDVRTKELLDDQLIALSLVFDVYRQAGRGDVRRNAMWKAVKGIEELETSLRTLLNSPAMSKEQRKQRKSDAYYKRHQQLQEKKEAENRQSWVVWLKEHTGVLRDTSIAQKGDVWNDTQYLLDILSEKFSHSQWAQSHWEVLIEEFGIEVADAFRDGCIDYWRKYIPEVRSEGMENPNSVPYAVIVGMSGLEMEVKHVPEWPNNLSEAEAHLVSRYALKELNGFPDWIQRFHKVFPQVLESRILKEIEWEFCKYDGEPTFCYVLSDISRLEWLQSKFIDRLLELLNNYEPKHNQTIENTLSIVLSAEGLDIDIFAALAKSKSGSVEEPSRQSLWLAAWTCVNAQQAIDMLAELLGQMDDQEKATQLAMSYITNLVGSRRVSSLHSIHENYMSVSILHSLIKLMHTYIHHSVDIERAGTGAYSPSLRDNAQDARDLLFRLLKEIPGKETYLALMDLAQTHPDERSRDWYAVHAKQRAELDAEPDAWTLEGITCFAAEAEKTPGNHRELFDLTISRLLDLKDDLEGGDLSNAGLLIKSRVERGHQIYIGNWLRDRSCGRYAVPLEEEMADAKRPDFRIHCPSIDAPVPIELKIADKWSGAELLERLENQLCGQYLRDVRSNCGIFLLTYCGGKKWQHPNTKKRLDFLGLIQLLQAKAHKIVASNSMVESIEVIGIDLTRRENKVVMVKS